MFWADGVGLRSFHSENMTEDLASMLCCDIKDQSIWKNFVAWDVLTISNIYNRLDCHRFDLHFAVWVVGNLS